MALQDLGPPCVPATETVGLEKMALPGTVWPTNYLEALGRALMKGVQVLRERARVEKDRV